MTLRLSSPARSRTAIEAAREIARRRQADADRIRSLARAIIAEPERGAELAAKIVEIVEGDHDAS